jgi:hypothetical protein
MTTERSCNRRTPAAGRSPLRLTGLQLLNHCENPASALAFAGGRRLDARGD